MIHHIMTALEKGPSGLKVLVPINLNVKRSLLLQYRQEFGDYSNVGLFWHRLLSAINLPISTELVKFARLTVTVTLFNRSLPREL